MRYCWLLILPLMIGCGSTNPDSAGNDSNGDKRGVIMLRYTVGSQSTEQREEGFLNTIKDEYPELTIVSSDEYAGTTLDSSLETAKQQMIKHGDKIDGFFAVCEPNANGVLLALEKEGLDGKIKFVGFDPNERMVLALRDKKMHGIVLQDPVTMGNLAVKTMVAHLDSEMKLDEEKIKEDGKIKKRISTGEYCATPENMDTEEMKRLLNPAQQNGTGYQPEEPDYVIAVIPKGSTHEFWKSVHYGANEAAKELAAVGIEVEVLYKGPQEEGDREGQIKLVSQYINKKVDGICLAPLDSGALRAPVALAKENGIPVVIFDSGLDDSDELCVSYVATDNYVGGALAARCLGDALTKQEAAAK